MQYFIKSFLNTQNTNLIVLVQFIKEKQQEYIAK